MGWICQHFVSIQLQHFVSKNSYGAVYYYIDIILQRIDKRYTNYYT